MDNNIENIEQNTFQDLNQVTYINLRFNRIRTLAPLGHMSRLNSLDLGENSITEVSEYYKNILHQKMTYFIVIFFTK